MTVLVAPMEDGVVVPTFDEVYAEHVGFVWRVLRACGVPADSLEDAAQDAFVVVHRQLPDFQGRAAITTWLFAITRRVAASHRRRGQRAIEPVVVPEITSPASPFDDVLRRQAADAIAAILDRMDEDRRIVFALVELEQMSVAEVARLLVINQNTAHSRLRLARADFAEAIRKAKVDR